MSAPADAASSTLPHTTLDYQTSYEQYQTGHWPYAVVPKNPDEDPDAIVMKDGNEYLFVGEDGEAYAGVFCRYMIEAGEYTDGEYTWLGFDTNEREVCLHLGQVYRGLFVGGKPGTGKTTMGANVLLQFAILGYGWLFVDPGGEECWEMIQRMPTHLRDRVVWIDPTSDIFDRTIGINYFDTVAKPGEAGFEAECEALVDDMLPLLEADYPFMKGVAENMMRSLIERHNDPEHDYDYCPIDLLFALADEESREQYQEFVDQSRLHFLKPYADKIAQALDEDLEPLLRRLKNWVESPLVRSVICQRNADLDFGRAIREDLLIIVNANTGDDRSRQLLTGALTRKLWTTVNTRLNEYERDAAEMEGKPIPNLGEAPAGEHYKPFFYLGDELHAIVDERTNLKQTLAMARKKRLGQILLTQQSNQLDRDNRKALLGNTSKLSYHPGNDPDEIKVLSDAFPGKEKEDMLMGDYRAMFIAKDSSGDDSEPFRLHMIPPMPPLRGKTERHEWIKHSLERYGKPVLADEELIEQIPAHFQGFINEDMIFLDDGPEFTERRRHMVLANALCLSRRAQRDEVPLAELVEQLHIDFADDPGLTDAKLENWIEKCVGSDVLAYVDGDELCVSVTDKGLETIFDSGDSQTAGGPEHRRGIARVLDELVRPEVGYVAEIPMQDGGELADLVARVPVSTGGVTFEEARKNYETLVEEYPAIHAIGGERDLAVEYEKETLTQPKQIAKNLAKAVKQDDPPHVLFVVDEGDDGKTFANKAAALVRKLRNMSNLQPPSDVDRLFWTDDELRVLAESYGRTEAIAVHPDPEIDVQWVEIDDEIILRERESKDVIARYDSPADVFNDQPSAGELPGYVIKSNGEYFSTDFGDEPYTSPSFKRVRKDFTVISAPFIPERAFDGEIPGEETWSVAVRPTDESVPLQLYDRESGDLTAFTKLGKNETRRDLEAESDDPSSTSSVTDRFEQFQESRSSSGD